MESGNTTTPTNPHDLHSKMWGRSRPPIPPVLTPTRAQIFVASMIYLTVQNLESVIKMYCIVLSFNHNTTVRPHPFTFGGMTGRLLAVSNRLFRLVKY